VLLPTVTRARELLFAGDALADASKLRRVLSLPVDLGELERGFRKVAERFIEWAKKRGAADSYVAQHRRAWWSVPLYEPAPIVCTYMARRPPAFVRNLCDARLLNIAHGLYPRQTLDAETTSGLLDYLRRHVGVAAGRTYAGGLTKFEPGELERIPVPPLEALRHAATACLD
jgi:adenine-specific DNA-methyltransferase